MPGENLVRQTAGTKAFLKEDRQMEITLVTMVVGACLVLENKKNPCGALSLEGI
jgi:hypothetical protein